jgi:hypothetical protein
MDMLPSKAAQHLAMDYPSKLWSRYHLRGSVNSKTDQSSRQERQERQHIRTFAAGIISVGGLAACAAQQTVVEPNQITLSKAMVDTVDALADARAEGLARQTKFGLYACTVTAVFNISATGTADNKLAVGLSGGPPAAVAPVTVNVSGSSETTQSGTRGNTETLVLAANECLPKPSSPAQPASGGKSAAAAKGGAAGGRAATPPITTVPVIPGIPPVPNR